VRVGIIRRKLVLTHASIVGEGMLNSFVSDSLVRIGKVSVARVLRGGCCGFWPHDAIHSVVLFTVSLVKPWLHVQFIAITCNTLHMHPRFKLQYV